MKQLFVVNMQDRRRLYVAAESWFDAVVNAAPKYSNGIPVACHKATVTDLERYFGHGPQWRARYAMWKQSN